MKIEVTEQSHVLATFLDVFPPASGPDTSRCPPDRLGAVACMWQSGKCTAVQLSVHSAATAPRVGGCSSLSGTGMSSGETRKLRSSWKTATHYWITIVS